MSNENGIQMDGVVFVKNVLFAESGMRIFVDYKQKVYKPNKSPFMLPDGTIGYQEYHVRVDEGESFEGLIHINYGHPSFESNYQRFKKHPIMTRNGFPMFNWVFKRPKSDDDMIPINFYDKNGRKITRKVYKVEDAGLTDKQKEQLMIDFSNEYPNYLKDLNTRFLTQVQKGEFKTIEERYNAFLDRKNKPKGTKGPKTPSFAEKNNFFPRKI